MWVYHRKGRNGEQENGTWALGPHRCGEWNTEKVEKRIFYDPKAIPITIE